MFNHPSEFVTFKASPHLPGVELYSARLVDHAFAPHVHDGYSLGAICPSSKLDRNVIKVEL